MTKLGFYRAFEERFYAPRNVIKNLRRQYLPFVQRLTSLYPGSAAFDIGCGRGEWLQLMQEIGLSPLGIDLDPGMLQDCYDLNLPAMQGDAIAVLKTLPDSSQAVVSAFHVVEHIPFEQLEQVVVESLRVLMPGGILIMETPNPENIIVATRNFYLDPTHQRPIPSQLLSFLTEYHGFARTKILRLQESTKLRDRMDVSLIEVLGGVSPDYAVVAQKSASAEAMAAFDIDFEAVHGIDLQELAGRFDAKINQRMVGLDERLAQAEVRIQQAEIRTEEAEVLTQYAVTMATHAEAQVQQVLAKACRAQAQSAEDRVSRAEAIANQAEARAVRLEALVEAIVQRSLAEQGVVQQLEAIRSSLSWRSTAPLRFAMGLVVHPRETVREAANEFIHHLIEHGQRPISFAISFVLKRPRISDQLNRWLSRYPALYQQLRDVARRNGLLLDLQYSMETGQVAHTFNDEGELELSPRAQRVYADLQTLVELQRRRAG